MPRIAVRPPEYFPRPEFCALMLAVDVFVLADTFQYSRQSFQNRTRIRTPHGWSWISIPLEGGQHGRSVRDVRVDRRDARWPVRHWRTLEYNYRSSPFFEFYEDMVAGTLHMRSESLADRTVASVHTLRSMLQIDTPVVVASDLAAAPSTMQGVLDAYPASDLVSLAESESADRVARHVLDWTESAYRQNFGGWQPGMSALDLVFNLGPEAREFVRNYTIRGKKAS